MSKRKSKIEDESLDDFLIRMHGDGIIATADEALPISSRDILHTPLSLDIALSGGIPDGTICLITGRPKSGKCVDIYNTFVLTNKGILNLRELKSLSTIKVLSHTGKQQEVSAWYDNGIADVKEIITKSGSEISITLDHPLMVLNEQGEKQWKIGRDLKKGDVLLCRRGDNTWGKKSINTEDAYVYGLLLGGGSVSYDKIQLRTNEETCYSAFTNFVSKRGGKVLTHKDKDHTFNSTKYGGILLDQGFYACMHKQIPKHIRRCNKKNICAMLSGYFDVNGVVRENIISITAESKILSIQIKTILMNLGILSDVKAGRIRRYKNGLSKQHWVINIKDDKSIKTFRNLINFCVPTKNNELELLCDRLSPTYCNRIPNLSNLIQKFQEAIMSRRVYFLPKPMRNFKKTIIKLKKKNVLSRRYILEKMLNYFSDYSEMSEYKKIQELTDDHIFFDKIVSLQDGKVHTADLSVPTDKSFIGNSIVNHNTTLCLELLRNAQISKRPAFYINIEKRCTPSLLSTIKGLDPTKLQIIPHKVDKQLTAEDYLNIIERISKTQKKAVVVIDSIAALSTMTEQEDQIGSNRDMAGPAKLLSAFFRRAQQIVDTNDVILIFISQMMTSREPRGPKYVEKGGIAVQYACSVWLKVTWTKQWDKNVETNAPDGHDMHITVQSSALGRPLLPCVLPLRYGTGIDNVKDIVTTAENLGLIDKAGAWYSIPMLADGKEIPKFQGLARLSNFLIESPQKLEKLELEIRDIVLQQKV